ncbi:MAG TPA: hypothetical protein VNE40_02270 [Candidatus Dormibacteraeota bacterium]|nr:hypothetical protein [Candidatus Dormibacteraeota bacterium]
MKTIGAKELRMNLDTVLDRVLSGEDIVISHRFKKPVRLTAERQYPHKNYSALQGLRAFDKSAKRKPSFDVNKPLNELYNESLFKKYG